MCIPKKLPKNCHFPKKNAKIRGRNFPEGQMQTFLRKFYSADSIIREMVVIDAVKIRIQNFIINSLKKDAKKDIHVSEE